MAPPVRLHSDRLKECWCQWVITACTPTQSRRKGTHPNICALDVHRKRLLHEVRPRKGPGPAAVCHVVETRLIYWQGV